MISELNNVGTLTVPPTHQRSCYAVFYALELHVQKILLELGNIPLYFVLDCKGLIAI